VKSRSRLFAISVAAVCLAASAAQATALPAWQPIAASGPTNLPPTQSEVQRLSVDAEEGHFTLTAHHVGGRATGELEVAHATTIKFLQISSGSFSVGETIAGDFIAPGTTIAAISGSTLTLSQPATNGGIFLKGLSFFAIDASATTATIPFDAGAGAVETALNGLSTIGGAGGSVMVKGGPGGAGAKAPYLVAYGGSLADSNLPLLESDSSGLSGGGNHVATITEVLDGGPGTSKIAIYAQNVGGAPSSGAATIKVTLPTHVVTTTTPAGQIPGEWSCPTGAGQESFECTTSVVATPGVTLRALWVPVRAETGATSGPVQIEVSGGGAAAASYDMPLIVSATPAPPGLQSWTAATYTDDGTVDTRAGAHPYSASTGILINTVRSKLGDVVPAGEFRDILVDTPPGFIGNPIATPQCPEAFEQETCEQPSIVAIAQVSYENFGITGPFSSVNDIEAPFGYPAKFRFTTGENQIVINVVASLRSDQDYGLEVGSRNTPQIKPVYGAFFTIWGTPADPGHDGQRCKKFEKNTGAAFECMTTSEILAAGGEEVAFLTNPVDCSEEAARPPIATLSVNTWQDPPGLFFERPVALRPVIECDNAELKEFHPDFTFEPSDTKADSPASFRTELTVPSEGLVNPAKRMTPTIKETVVSLPKGVVLNASAADGLAACSEAQIGLKNEIDPATGLPKPEPAPNHIRFDKNPNTCPDASKIGSGALKSELIEEPLHGALYLAAQGNGNPFGSLFAIYLVIEDPRHGIFIKLPGEVQVDKGDGQQRIVFKDLPPLPFTYLRLTLKGGSRSPLASPTSCGTFVTTATNTPWSAPESGSPAASANSFDINQGPNGLPCAPTPQDRPFNVALNAGTDSTTAGAHSPLTFQITRPDGSQELNTLELGTAPGLVASLKGIPECGASNAQVEAKTGKQEEASPSCPAASQIGRTLTGAGSGPTPFYSAGKLYLSGPYKGAPLSVIAITPAVAGPFDLGNVVVRTALFVNRQSAQVTAKTDPIPQILEGVPLRIKDVRVILDRKDFALNPTNCEASAITVHATGNSGAAKDLSARFQVGGCEKLDFKPKFAAKLSGGTKRNDHPAFTATLTYPEGPGYANIRDVQVALPHSEFLDQAHINTICTRPQAAAHQCPAGSIYGYAEATTPLLDGKLSGPVFLKSSDHKLPDLAIALKGPDAQPIEVEFQGRIDSVKGQIRNTIEGLPDVPVSSFTLKMKGGNKGLLVNSRNLCATKTARMTVHMVAQNNKRSDTRPQLQNSCGPKGKKGKHKHQRPRQRRHGRLLSGLIAGW
jgi:hypothetical protein